MIDGDVRIHPGSKTLGRSVGPGKKARQSFQAQAEKPLFTDTHRTISKRSSEYWLLTGHKKCFVLLCPIDEKHLLSYISEFVHDGYRLDHGLSGSCTKEKCTKSGNFQFDINSTFQNTERFSENTSLSLQQVFTLASTTSL